MLNLKKTAVAVLALSSSAVFAGTMGPVCAPGAVTVPCERQAWDFGITALYLKPNYNGGAAYTGYTQTDAGNAINSSAIDTDPNWGWGFKLEGSYHFGMGNDLNLNWGHYSHRTNMNFAGGTAASHTVLNVLGAADALGFGQGAWSDAETMAHDTSKWDAVNLELGQQVRYHDHLGVRFHGGFQFARVENEYGFSTNGAVNNGADVPNGIINGTGTVKFNGFGPRVGATMGYSIVDNLTGFAYAGTALLIGTSKFDAFNAERNRNGAGDQFAVNGSFTAVVPEVQAGLGAAYTTAMASGDLSINAGYMWDDYINVLQGYGADKTDFALTGPFLGVKYVGNM